MRAWTKCRIVLKLCLIVGFLGLAAEPSATAMQMCAPDDCVWTSQGQSWCVADGDCVVETHVDEGGMIHEHRFCCVCNYGCTMFPG